MPLKKYMSTNYSLPQPGISDDFKLTYPALNDLIVKNAMIHAADKVYLWPIHQR